MVVLGRLIIKTLPINDNVNFYQHSNYDYLIFLILETIQQMRKIKISGDDPKLLEYDNI